MYTRSCLDARVRVVVLTPLYIPFLIDILWHGYLKQEPCHLHLNYRCIF